MFRKLNYKKKNYLLVAIILLTLIVIYKLSLLNTIEKYKDFISLKEKIKTVSEAPKEIEILQNQIVKIDQFFGSDSDSLFNKRELLIDYTSNYCKKNRLEISLITEPIYEYRNKILIETNQLILQGSFINMIKYLNSIEEYHKTGKISSLYFYKEKNIRTKNEKLLLKIYVQNIINQTNELSQNIDL